MLSHNSVAHSTWIPHDDVIKRKHFPCYWPFVRGTHRSPVDSPHKGKWRGALVFSLICASRIGWANNRDAGDLRRHRTHYNVTVTRGMDVPCTCLVPCGPLTQKRKCRLGYSLGLHWRRWSLSSTSPTKTRTVTQRTFPFYCIRLSFPPKIFTTDNLWRLLFCLLKPNLCSILVTATLYEISCYIGPRYIESLFWLVDWTSLFCHF